MAESSLLAFLSGYRGEQDYRVLQGPWAGERISVRCYKLDWYREDYRLFAGKVWRCSAEQYEREIVSSAGLVRCQPRPYEVVPQEIVLEVNLHLAHWAVQHRDLAYGILRAGVYHQGEGWLPANDLPTEVASRTKDVPFPPVAVTLINTIES